MSKYAIYKPKGSALEYSEWACNFHVGCSNGCSYCYLKKGRGAKVLGGNVPTLKKCFKDEKHAIEVFKKELAKNLPELKEHGIFFSFTTDPMLKETVALTLDAVYECRENDVPVKILTKSVEHMDWFIHECNKYCFDLSRIAIGCTLTGHDELEPNASPNQKRIEYLKICKDYGFKTFASIEPIIDMKSSSKMIREAKGICDHFKIGLESGKKFDSTEVRLWINFTNQFIGDTGTIYWKDSIIKLSGMNRDELPSNCVGRDYSIFNIQN
jgi:DNA repair photolyase